MNEKGKAVILLGPPGSGKSSLAEKINKHLPIEVFESGELLRQEMEKGSELGGRIESFVEKGELAPSELMIEALGRAMSDAECRNIVFDGFPRKMDQVIPFFAMISENDFELSAVIILQLSKDVGTQRIVGRRVCAGCGAVYNRDFDPPVQSGVCNRCGGTLVKRKDDTTETVNRRWESYEGQTIPVIEYLESNYPGVIHEVAAQADIDRVVYQVSSIIRLSMSPASSGE